MAETEQLRKDEPQSETISPIKDYVNGLTTGIFGPFIIDEKMQPKKMGGAIFNIILMTIMGWLSFAYIFVKRLHLNEFMHGNLDAPAKVFAYENNLIFMFETFGLIIGVMLILPMLTQIVIQKFVLKQNVDYKNIVIQAAYSTFSFSLFALTVILPMTLSNTTDLFIGATKLSIIIFYIFFWTTIAWTFLCFCWNMSKTSGVPLKFTLIHMWVPILLLIVGCFVVVI